MSRLSQAVVMLLFGGALLKITLTDVFLRYVKPGLRPILIVAAILLIAAAVMTIWYELRPIPAASPDHDHDRGHDDGPGHDDDGHGHGHHEPRIGWLLMLPVLGLLLITPPALGAYSAGQSGSVALQSGDSNYPPLPPGDPAQVGLLDYASRAVFDGGKSLTGRTIELSGFVTPGAGGHAMLARIVLTCCAADGRPIKIGLNGPLAVDAAANSWVQVIGTYSSQVGKDPVSKSDVAYLTVKSWQQIGEPTQPYD
jgi:uncharacterized repeat protein (TIGR03943 family)